MEMGGLTTYAVFFLTSVGIYAIVCLALNVQWGLSGQFNFGIVAFYALGAYTSGLLTAKAGWPVGLAMPMAAVSPDTSARESHPWRAAAESSPAMAEAEAHLVGGAAGR